VWPRAALPKVGFARFREAQALRKKLLDPCISCLLFSLWFVCYFEVVIDYALLYTGCYSWDCCVPSSIGREIDYILQVGSLGEREMETRELNWGLEQFCFLTFTPTYFSKIDKACRYQRYSCLADDVHSMRDKETCRHNCRGRGLSLPVGSPPGCERRFIRHT
jgi:hypothetical protein